MTAPPNEHERDRIARNEAVFRNINEAIRNGRWPGEPQPVAFRCECAQLGCNDMVELPVEVYERIRSDPRRFVLAPGHDIPGAEAVVESHPGFVVVEKRGDAAAVVEQLDPRR